MAIVGFTLSVFSALLTYLKTWILALSFSSTELGFYVYITTIIGWVVTIFASGLNSGLLSYLVNCNRQDVLRSVIGWVLSLSIKRGIVGVVAAFAIYAILIQPQQIDHFMLYSAISLMIPISILIYSLNSVLIYQGKVSLSGYINTFVLNGGSVFLLFLLNIFELNFYGLAMVAVIPTFVAFWLLIKITKYKPLFGSFDNINEEKTSILNRSNHMLISGLLYAYWIKAESIFLNYGCGASCVAKFYIPYQFAFVLTMINSVLYNIVSSKLSKENSDLGYQSRLYNNASLLGFYINLVAFSFIYLNSSELLSLFGNEYNTNQGALTIKLVGASFLLYSYYGSTSEIYLNMLGKHKQLLHSAVITAVISVLANVIFTLQYGLIGAVISFSITIMSASLIRMYLIKIYLGIHLKNDFSVVVLTAFLVLAMEFILMLLAQMAIYSKIITINLIIIFFAASISLYYRKYIIENLRFIGIGEGRVKE